MTSHPHIFKLDMANIILLVAAIPIPFKVEVAIPTYIGS